MNNESMELQEITDISQLMKWRAEVIETVFNQKPSAELLQENLKYYQKHIPDGSHRAFIALYNGEETGCGAICLTDELPSPDNPSGHCAYLMNIYVRAPYREHGVAHAIVKKLIEEAKNAGCGKIYLETTPDGRPVYASLGFKDLPDIMKLESEL